MKWVECTTFWSPLDNTMNLFAFVYVILVSCTLSLIYLLLNTTFSFAHAWWHLYILFWLPIISVSSFIFYPREVLSCCHTPFILFFFRPERLVFHSTLCEHISLPHQRPTYHIKIGLPNDWIYTKTTCYQQFSAKFNVFPITSCIPNRERFCDFGMRETMDRFL